MKKSDIEIKNIFTVAGLKSPSVDFGKIVFQHVSKAILENAQNLIEDPIPMTIGSFFSNIGTGIIKKKQSLQLSLQMAKAQYIESLWNIYESQCKVEKSVDKKNVVDSICNDHATISNFINRNLMTTTLETRTASLINACLEGLETSTPNHPHLDNDWLDSLDTAQAVFVRETDSFEDYGYTRSNEDLKLENEYRKKQKSPPKPFSQSIKPIQTPMSNLIAPSLSLIVKENNINPLLAPEQLSEPLNVTDQAKYHLHYALQSLQWCGEMIMATKDIRLQEYLFSHFHLWKYLFIEQGMTLSRGLNLAHQLFHGLIALSGDTKLGSIWLKDNDLVSYWFRYSNSYESRQKEINSEVLNHYLSFGQESNRDRVEQQSSMVENSVREAVQLYLAILKGEKRTEYEQMMNGETRVFDELSAGVLSYEIKNELTEIEKKLAGLVENLLKKIQSVGTNEAKHYLIKVLYHLKHLECLPIAFRTFPQQRYICFHLNSMILNAQYFIENLGLYLQFIEGNAEINKKQLEFHEGIHDFMAYPKLYELIPPLEFGSLEMLNVGKGSEYLYTYFSKKRKRVSPLMVQLSRFFAFSQEATRTGEGFIPVGYKEMSLLQLHSQFITKLKDTVHILEKLL